MPRSLRRYLPAVRCLDRTLRLVGSPRKNPQAVAQPGAQDMRVSFDDRGFTGLSAQRDLYGAQVLAPNARRGVVLKYRVEGVDWLDLYHNDPVKTAPSPDTMVLLERRRRHCAEVGADLSDRRTGPRLDD